MKKIIRNILSLILVVSILTLPLTSFADDATLGQYDNPYLLSTTSTHFTVVVGAESEAWVKVDDCIGSTLNVLKATTADYMIMYCRQPHTPETASGNNTLTMEMVNGADMFNIYNPGTTSVELQLELIGGTGIVEQGTVDNPELITMSTNMFGGVGASATKELGAGNEGYYYKTVAPADGIITVSIGAYDADFNSIGWMYFVNNDTKGIYGDTHWSDEEESVFYEEVNVSKDDVIIAFASTYNPSNQWSNPEGTISVDFSFSAVGTSGNPEVITEGSYAPEFEASSQGYHYKWTASEAGTATVAMSDNNTNGWQYIINVEKADGTFKYGDTHWCDDDPVVSSESHDVVTGDILTVFVNTYNPSNEFNTPAGTVNWTLSFTAGEGGNDGGNGDDNGNEGGNEDDNGGEVTPPPAEENYTTGETPLEVGTKEYPLIEGYDYTVFTFEPSQTGKYTFTAANGLIGIVSTNGMWVTVEPTSETITENSFVWECTGVGQSIWVAAKYSPVTRALDDGKSVSISISREDIVIDTMPWTTYVNTHKPQPFTFTGDADKLEPVEVFDNNVDKPVMGSDGYYHLNSATGPILYVDLDDTMMNLVDAMSYGQVKDIIMDGDKIVSKIDYNEAIGQYIDCADEPLCLYPLTDDLIAIYKGTGHFQGWYGEDGWLGTTADDGYLFACYYINDGSVNNPTPPNPDVFNPNAPSFGGNNGSTGKPVGSGNSFGSGVQAGKPVTGTQVGKPVTGAAQTFDPFVINLAVLTVSGLGVVVASRKKR